MTVPIDDPVTSIAIGRCAARLRKTAALVAGGMASVTSTSAASMVRVA
jgi:hypothetical protein